MAGSKLASKFRQTFYDAVAELGQHVEQDILNAFDNEFGYDEDGNKVPWDELSEWYVNAKPPRGRGGSAHPILHFEGDLRAAIKVVTSGASISTDVTSKKMKKRGGKGKISVADISKNLSGTRPHTNPSAKWNPESSRGDKNVTELFNRYFDNFIDEAISEGLL